MTVLGAGGGGAAGSPAAIPVAVQQPTATMAAATPAIYVDVIARQRSAQAGRRPRFWQGGAMNVPSTPESAAEAPACFRHPERVTYVRCTRCNRYACGDCMRSAAAGQRCVECVQADAQPAHRSRRRAGRRWWASSVPVVSYGLIAANVLAFVVQVLSTGLTRELVLWAPAVADGQVYRLVTSAFLHYGMTHLLLNMWALYVLGPALEMLLGRTWFGALYGLSALGGSVTVYMLAPINTATAGASGAIFGLFGATFVVARRLRLDVGWVGVVILANLVFTFSIPRISWQGHIGGLITGTLVTLAYVYAPHRRSNQVQAAVTLAVLVLLAALTWWRTAELVARLGLG